MLSTPALVFCIFLISICFPLVSLIVRARKHGHLKAALRFILYFTIATAGMLIIGLVHLGLWPPEVAPLGGLLLVTFGIIFVIRGVQKKSDIDEMLMDLSNGRFVPDRFLAEKYGKSYFYFKSIVLGSAFMIGGVLSILNLVTRTR